MAKRYYWLKLYDDFFSSKRIKKLRKIAGGDTYTIIYLKMQLKAMKNDGILEYSGLENSFAEEIALDLDESPDDVAVTINYLINCELCETSDNAMLLPYAIRNVGSEGASAERMRKLRDKESSNLLSSVTSASQCDARPSLCDKSVTEIQDTRDKIQETIDRDKIQEQKENINQYPSLDDIKSFCKEKNLIAIDAESVFRYYSSLNWMIDNVPIRNWQGLLISLNRKEERRNERKHNKFDGNELQQIAGITRL